MHKGISKIQRTRTGGSGQVQSVDPEQLGNRRSKSIFINNSSIGDRSGASITMLSVNNGDPLPALIDSGAAVSLLSEGFSKDLKLVVKPLDNDLRFRSAGKDKLLVLGMAVVKVTIGKSVFNERFYITRNLSHRIIIGSDIFWKHRIDLKFSTSEIVINKQPNPMFGGRCDEINSIDSNIYHKPSEQVQFEDGYLSATEIKQIKALVDEFTDIFAKDSEDIGKTSFTHKNSVSNHLHRSNGTVQA